MKDAGEKPFKIMVFGEGGVGKSGKHHSTGSSFVRSFLSVHCAYELVFRGKTQAQVRLKRAIDIKIGLTKTKTRGYVQRYSSECFGYAHPFAGKSKPSIMC